MGFVLLGSFLVLALLVMLYLLRSTLRWVKGKSVEHQDFHE